MLILDSKQINQKIRRLAYEIVEHNINQDEILLVGLNTNGKTLANQLQKEIATIEQHDINIRTTGAQYCTDTRSVKLDMELSDVTSKSIIIVDDVANTGSTLFKTAALFAHSKMSSLKAAVLIDRKHKTYPIEVDYVGLSLATTINDHIHVEFNSEYSAKAVLDDRSY